MQPLARNLRAGSREAERINAPTGGAHLARFQGNIHSGSDRTAATLLFLVLLAALLIGAWWLGDTDGFTAFWSGVRDNLTPNR